MGWQYIGATAPILSYMQPMLTYSETSVLSYSQPTQTYLQPVQSYAAPLQTKTCKQRMHLMQLPVMQQVVQQVHNHQNVEEVPQLQMVEIVVLFSRMEIKGRDTHVPRIHT